ncbi:hypothetical protein AAFF_G00189460 [Aldrovandia affinis]|uniref:Uncharacterized protein n=1 Tax=Aldrovandia affinis TaxID=143900 RepID=A0AAD7RJV4_9TELE|nr:hypothetical protein AAFF_G00189460 [Aldrovandia affinis]
MASINSVSKGDTIYACHLALASGNQRSVTCFRTDTGQQPPAVRHYLFELTSTICEDTFHRSYPEFAYCNFKKEQLCLVEHFVCSACTPDMLAISADGEALLLKEIQGD